MFKVARRERVAAQWSSHNALPRTRPRRESKRAMRSAIALSDNTQMFNAAASTGKRNCKVCNWSTAFKNNGTKYLLDAHMCADPMMPERNLDPGRLQLVRPPSYPYCDRHCDDVNASKTLFRRTNVKLREQVRNHVL